MIRVVDLHKTFGRQRVLKGVNLDLEAGKITTIIGGSGSGKTVLLKHLNALLLPDRGGIFVGDKDITRLGQTALNEVRKKFGVLFQGAALLDSMTVYDNVAFPLRERTKLKEPEIDKKVRDSLEQVGLGEMGYKYPAEVSGGMKKRAGLARAIIRNPAIVLYDEPTAGLDPVMASTINDLILDLQKKLDVTSILVTHDMSSAFRVSTRIAMLLKGRIVKVGTPEEFRASDDPVVRQFIYGESEGPLTRDRA
jgi:phospholipid/cholesterol/gamma-HCH transport system ATP-binding protein